MGIEAIGNVSAGYQGSVVVKQPAEAVEAASTVARQEAASQVAVTEHMTVAGSGAGSEADGTKAKQETATMKDVNEINKIINSNTVAEFGYNEPTNRITIKIKDKETNEVIKEIPSDKALEMLAKAWELAGLLVDERR